MTIFNITAGAIHFLKVFNDDIFIVLIRAILQKYTPQFPSWDHLQ